MRTLMFTVICLVFSFGGNGSISIDKEKRVGEEIKKFLETYHYRDLKIDDNVSQKAFAEFLKKVDYSKWFLLSSEIDRLKKYEFKLDDLFVSGKNKLLDEVMPLMTARIKQAEALRVKTFKKQFSFSSNEKLELDPDKKDWPKNMKEWEKRWEKTFKHAVINRYLSYVEEQKDLKKNKKEKGKEKKKDKKKKKTEVLSEAEMRKKSHEAIAKKYQRYFSRLLKDQRVDYFEKYVNSVTSIFDPHTVYFPPKKREDFDIDISGQLEGIGAVLSEDGAYIKVVSIVVGGAAWRQKGLEVDDVILMVGEGDKEPVDLVDMRVDDAVRYIRGKKGTIVSLTVKKVDGSRKTIKITRDVVQVGASYAKSSVLQLKGNKRKIGYIHLPKFYRSFNDANGPNCTNDVREELEFLKKQNVDGVILDLRNNGGGSLEDAKQMTGLFIKKGPIVQTKDYSDQIAVLKDVDTSVTYGGPLIVMTNRFSASASEILAGAIQDYKRGIIVGGETTHGKGTVQAVVSIGGRSNIFPRFQSEKLGGLKVTIQQFYRVNGDSTQYKGIAPDIVLPDPMGYAESREQDLEYSLPWDKVASLKYDKWNKHKISQLNLLNKRSQSRVNKSKHFKKISDSVTYLKKRRNDTLVELDVKKLMKESEEGKKQAEKLKVNKVNKKLSVTKFADSLKKHETILPSDEKQWNKDFKQRKEEWVEGLQKDVLLDETLKIMNDFIDINKGQKLSSSVAVK